ncbi:MAG: cysteine hydrolase, partial [Xanthobacteraceae bacterium]
MNYDYKAYPSYIAIGDRPKQNPVSLEERLDPSSTALVVIDVQNDFCDRAGRNGLDGEDLSQILAILGPLRALIRKARQKHIFTIFVRSSYDAIRGRALREQQRTRRGFDGGICREGTWGIEFVQGTGPEGLPGEAVVTKHSYGAFGGTEIDLLLRSNGIKSVVLAGVGTETSVESIARVAFFLDYKVLIA